MTRIAVESAMSVFKDTTKALSRDLAKIATETALEALEKRAIFDQMDPFLNSHHTESVSIASDQAFPGSNRERQAFKRQVAAYYGLTASDDGSLIDMTDQPRPFQEVHLAHIWPRSYQNWDLPCAHLGLPGEFYRDVRNFLLLPEDLHRAFDAGHVVFIPMPEEVVDGVAQRKILIQVIRPDKLGACQGVTALHDTYLHIPSSNLPYCRLLAFFALMAKKQVDVGAVIEGRMREAVDDGTNSSGGTTRLRVASAALIASNKVKFHH